MEKGGNIDLGERLPSNSRKSAGIRWKETVTVKPIEFKEEEKLVARSPAGSANPILRQKSYSPDFRHSKTPSRERTFKTSTYSECLRGNVGSRPNISREKSFAEDAFLYVENTRKVDSNTRKSSRIKTSDSPLTKQTNLSREKEKSRPLTRPITSEKLASAMAFARTTTPQVSRPCTPGTPGTPSGRRTPYVAILEYFYNPYQVYRNQSSLKEEGDLPLKKIRVGLKGKSKHHPDFTTNDTTGKNSLWAMGNKYWPKSPAIYPIHAGTMMSPFSAFEPENQGNENVIIRNPFKQVQMNLNQRLRPTTPCDEVKEQTAVGIYEVNKVLSKQTAPKIVKIKGRLLKGRLHPLMSFKLDGPSINQCQGVQPDKRPNSPSQSRLIQKKKELLMQFQENRSQIWHPTGRESIHRTSLASEDGCNESANNKERNEET